MKFDKKIENGFWIYRFEDGTEIEINLTPYVFKGNLHYESHYKDWSYTQDNPAIEDEFDTYEDFFDWVAASTLMKLGNGSF